MNSVLNRRSFLRKTAAFAGAISASSLLPRSNLLEASASPNRLRCVQIGCGGRAMTHLSWIINQSRDSLIAIVDPDEKRHAEVFRWLKKQNQDPGKVKTFTDYRVMFDKIGNQIDAVFIATPNHHHAPAALLAMQHGKAVYCEKPLCHDIAEARKLREQARQSKVPTQMGIQGHCQGGYQRLCEFIQAGVVGNITETHSWTDRANGGIGPRPPTLPVPQGLHWDTWIGPAPYRDYHADLHPHEWHGWYDFGNGSLGNMGCHVLDGVFWGLKLEHPTTIEVEQMRDGSDERYPTGSRIRWDFPERGDLPAIKVHWYEGLKPEADPSAIGRLRSVKEGSRNLPPLLEELQKQYPDEDFDSNGTLYVGEKGILYTATYGGGMHILDREKMRAFSSLPKTLPRPKNVMDDFLDAVREGKTETAAAFDYSARLTEFTLLGNLAQRAGAGNPLNWDGVGMKVTNLSDLNRWISRTPRKGWLA